MHAYFHAWHFLYTQIQLTNWFGNVVAGVVVFVVVDVCWQLFLKKWVKAEIAKIHAEELRKHQIKVEAHAERLHKEVLDQAENHHQSHLAALKEK